MSNLKSSQLQKTAVKTLKASGMSSSAQETSAILAKINDIVQKNKLLSEHYDISNKVVDFEHPKDLQTLLPLDIGKEGVSDAELEKIRLNVDVKFDLM